MYVLVLISGYGKNLCVYLDWLLLDGVELAYDATTGYSGRVVLTDVTFSYPKPVITPRSLRLESVGTGGLKLSNDGTFAYINLPASSATTGIWVTFNGDFQDETSDIVVTYTDGTLSFNCSVESGWVTDEALLCRTEPGVPTGAYHFTVEVAGQLSDAGIDQMYSLLTPEITSVSGCTDNGNGTENCPTTGMVTITISGTHFGEGMVGPISTVSPYRRIDRDRIYLLNPIHAIHI